jgi:hypothetical protein
VNAVGRRVVISVRGTPDLLNAIPLLKAVPIETELRDNTPVASFTAPCPDQGIAAFDPTRNRGWTALHVGRCTAGKTVTITTAPAAMARVCKGLYGCDDPGGTPPPACEFASPARFPEHAGLIKPTAVQGGELSFQCPDNGPLIDPTDPCASTARYGYFSVMVADPDPGDDVRGRGRDRGAPPT